MAKCIPCLEIRGVELDLVVNAYEVCGDEREKHKTNSVETDNEQRGSQRDCISLIHSVVICRWVNGGVSAQMLAQESQNSTT